jgi:hypothetical protein
MLGARVLHNPRMSLRRRISNLKTPGRRGLNHFPHRQGKRGRRVHGDEPGRAKYPPAPDHGIRRASGISNLRQLGVCILFELFKSFFPKFIPLQIRPNFFT